MTKKDRHLAVCSDLCSIQLSKTRAKGLEFKEVYLLDVNEGMIPYKKANLPAEIEEERRLFYVGMTRAEKRLHILYVKTRYNKKLKPSRFLDVLRPRDS